MRKGPILLLTGDYGSGHVQAARALQESLARLFPDIAAVTRDFMADAHPRVHPISKYVYLGGVKTFPRTYGYLFRKTRRSNPFSKGLKAFNGLGLGKFIETLGRMQPSAVVSTFPLAAGAMSMLRADGLYNGPTVTVITDYTDHSYWINPHTDIYLVGSLQTAEKLVLQGVERASIKVTGIPIRQQYSRVYDRKAIRSEIGLRPDVPTVLLMGGGGGMLGLDMFDSLCRYLSMHAGRMQFIVICGNNDKLQRQLSRLAAEHALPMVVTGFTDRIPELMAASDLLITKSGGLTSSEALAAGLPMIIYRPLPGQEEDNASYLLQTGAAVRVQHTDELLSTLSSLLGDPARIGRMRKRAQKAGKPFAADLAASCIAAIREQGTVSMPAGAIRRNYSYI